MGGIRTPHAAEYYVNRPEMRFVDLSFDPFRANLEKKRTDQRFYMDAPFLQGIFLRFSDEESCISISGLACGIAAGPDEIR